MAVFRHLREISALEIQRIWRGTRTKRLFKNSQPAGAVIIWKWGQPESDIRVAGDFSDGDTWKMTWYEQSKDHRILIPPRILLGRDRIEFKFVVNGQWTCDGTVAMCEDGEGNVNNFISINQSNDRATPSVTPRIHMPDDVRDSQDATVPQYVESAPPVLKLRKQLTSSDKPNQDGIVIRSVRRPLPLPEKRTYGN